MPQFSQSAFLHHFNITNMSRSVLGSELANLVRVIYQENTGLKHFFYVLGSEEVILILIVCLT